MTFEEMEKSLLPLHDHQVAEGVMLHRVENNLDRLEAMVEKNTQAIEKLAEIAESHESRLQVMQAAMTALFERMDRFIRGLESDGHKGGGSDDV